MRKFDVISKAFQLQDKLMQLRQKSREMIFDVNVTAEDHMACCDACVAVHRELRALSDDLPYEYFAYLVAERHAPGS